MNIGGPALVDANYGAENVNYIVGNKGHKAWNSAPVSVAHPYGKREAKLYSTERYTLDTALTYKIPVPSWAIADVTTLHAETYFDAPGKRVFNIVINGVTVENNLDVFVSAGGKNKGLSRTFPSIRPVNGFITISFTKVVENPFVNAIDVLAFRAAAYAIPGREDGICTGPSK